MLQTCSKAHDRGHGRSSGTATAVVLLHGIDMAAKLTPKLLCLRPYTGVGFCFGQRSFFSQWVVVTVEIHSCSKC